MAGKATWPASHTTHESHGTSSVTALALLSLYQTCTFLKTVRVIWEGGCEGATMELAFNLTVSKGIALESDLPYAGVSASQQISVPVSIKIRVPWTGHR